jgi:hypothetical protein
MVLWWGYWHWDYPNTKCIGSNVLLVGMIGELYIAESITIHTELLYVVSIVKKRIGHIMTRVRDWTAMVSASVIVSVMVYWWCSLYWMGKFWFLKSRRGGRLLNRPPFGVYYAFEKSTFLILKVGLKKKDPSPLRAPARARARAPARDPLWSPRH